MEKLKKWFANLKTKIVKMVCKLWAKIHKIPKQTRVDIVAAPVAYATGVFLLRKAREVSYTRYNAYLRMGGVKYFGRNVVGDIPDSDSWVLYFKELCLFTAGCAVAVYFSEVLGRLIMAACEKIKTRFAKNVDSIVEE